ncbi:bioA [Wigglesworthia glossinidia endosymbiont of Glossina brevipalpis]|uniref:Adenosylmethionine-8-amino-7-oxononanoate aminotransferase n=1 Tax=Wigglesworthia glossinidia brevipalpis TaxID=36870 RepID=Q8D2A2_WIGBR|nr:bioA [Wigglesworthia glossinidia endosymbiont of Glossina brevipalpis]
MNINEVNFDRYYIWHPYSSITKPLKTYHVVSAKKCKLKLINGKKLIDGMSSWWTVIHGYNHPKINQAIINQIKKVSHVMFGGITHSPAIKLCKKIIKLTPKGLECVFLSDSGSVSIEVALKMALHYWFSKNERKKVKFLSLRGGYHGDTFGALSVCDPKNSMHNIYQGYLPNQEFTNTFDRKFNEKWESGDDLNLVKLIEKHHKKLAAVIIEPIVQGVGGMNFYHKQYLISIKKLCKFYKILLIVDEIATGFGRTGKLFACNYSKITPDILCIGKALTGGAITLAATITKRKVSETICNKKTPEFMHGPTFMANPLSCAASCANLSLIEEGKWIQQVKFIYQEMCKYLYPLIEHSYVKDVRILGAIGVVETKFFVNLENIQNWFVRHGAWIRPFRKLIYLIPPYIISSYELKFLIKLISLSLNDDKNFLYIKN